MVSEHGHVWVFCWLGMYEAGDIWLLGFLHGFSSRVLEECVGLYQKSGLKSLDDVPGLEKSRGALVGSSGEAGGLGKRGLNKSPGKWSCAWG